MMNIDDIKDNIGHLLADRGLTTEYKEQAVRLMLYHLYVAMDIYRYMTFAEKNKAGFWYRTFKSSYRLTGFLKERKRKRDKEKSPLHPSYKERETEVKEKAQTYTHITMRETADLEKRQKAFRELCMSFKNEYDELYLENFFCHWGQEVNGTGLMLWETKKSWSLRLRLRAWSKKSFQLNDKAAALRLEREKRKMTKQQTANTAEQQAIAAKREQDNARLEQEMEESKQNQMLTDEYLRKNPNGLLAQMARERQAREEKVPQIALQRHTLNERTPHSQREKEKK